MIVLSNSYALINTTQNCMYAINRNTMVTMVNLINKYSFFSFQFIFNKGRCVYSGNDYDVLTNDKMSNCRGHSIILQ